MLSTAPAYAVAERERMQGREASKHVKAQAIATGTTFRSVGLAQGH